MWSSGNHNYKYLFITWRFVVATQHFYYQHWGRWEMEEKQRHAGEAGQLANGPHSLRDMLSWFETETETGNAPNALKNPFSPPFFLLPFTPLSIFFCPFSMTRTVVDQSVDIKGSRSLAGCSVPHSSPPSYSFHMCQWGWKGCPAWAQFKWETMPFEHSPEQFLKEVQRCQPSLCNPLHEASVGIRGLATREIALFLFSSGSPDDLIQLDTGSNL